MQIFLIIIHVIACLLLIVVILLQAGRGGGLSDIAGGAQTQSIFGTETNTFMKRLTEIFAVVFILTSLSLGIISTHQGKSLMEKHRLTENFKKNLPFSESAQKPAVSEASPPAVPMAVVQTSAQPTAPAVAVSPSVPAEGNAK